MTFTNGAPWPAGKGKKKGRGNTGAADHQKSKERDLIVEKGGGGKRKKKAQRGFASPESHGGKEKKPFFRPPMSKRENV